MCICTKKFKEMIKKWDIEEETIGLETGPEEDHSAIYHPGKDQAGTTEEAPATTFMVHPTSHPLTFNQKRKQQY
jgi:hypothetical protein